MNQPEPVPGPRLGVGILGCGQAVQALHLPALAALGDLFRITHLVDASPFVAETLAGRLDTRWGTDPEALLADPDVDVVLVAAPDVYHARFAIDACRAGKKAVLVEKPLALTANEALAVARESERCGVPVQVGTMHRYDPAFLRTERFLDQQPELVLVETFIGDNNQFRADQVSLVTGPPARGDGSASFLGYIAAVAQSSNLDVPFSYAMTTIMALTLTTHDLALLRSTLGEPDRIGHVTPFQGTGYEAVLHYGPTTVVMIAHENAGRYADWRVRWVNRQRQVELSFPPSWGASNQAVLSVSELDDGMERTERFDSRFETGFTGEWRHLHRVAIGEAPSLTPASDAAADIALIERMISTATAKPPKVVSPLGVAILGAGWITYFHAPVFAALADTEVRTIASRSMRSAEQHARPFGATASTFDQLPQVLGRDDVDLVVVAGPPALHASHTIAALNAGKHVLVEKPLCCTLSEADAIAKAEDGNPGMVAYAENWGYIPWVEEAARLSGPDSRLANQLGAVHSIDVFARNKRPDYGSFLDPVWGGGVLFDLGPHPIWFALLLAGNRTIESVRTEQMESSSEKETEDSVTVTLTTADGIPITIDVSWRQPEGTESNGAAISFENGDILVDLQPVPSLRLRRKDETEESIEFPVEQGLVKSLLVNFGYYSEVTDFVDAVRNDRKPRLGVAEGRSVLEIILAASHSAATEASVALPFTGPRDKTPVELWRARAAG